MGAFTCLSFLPRRFFDKSCLTNASMLQLWTLLWIRMRMYSSHTSNFTSVSDFLAETHAAINTFLYKTKRRQYKQTQIFDQRVSGMNNFITAEEMLLGKVKHIICFLLPNQIQGTYCKYESCGETLLLLCSVCIPDQHVCAFCTTALGKTIINNIK